MQAGRYPVCLPLYHPLQDDHMNITLQQWLARQPYTPTTDSDRYYTRLANRLYDEIKQSPLKTRWSDDAVKSICCDLVGYFADILSGTGLWAAFVAQHQAFYGRTLPFFTPEAYYEGEVNRDDVRVLLWYLWGRHVRLVYPAGMESKHAVDASAYLENLTGKTGEELARFWQAFTAYWVDFSHLENVLYWGAPALTLLLVLVFWRTGRMKGRHAAALTAGLAGSLALYTGGLAATYVFSMPTEEMLVLASIGRYSLTFSLLVAGGGLLLALYLRQPERRWAVRWLPAAGSLLVCLAMTLAWGDTAPLYSRTYHRRSEQQFWLDVKARYGLPEGADYLFYTNGEPVDAWADQFVARYVFNTDALDFWQRQYAAPDLDTICYGYDYIVFLGPDEKSDRLLTDWGFDPDTAWLETVLFSARQDEYLQAGIPLPEGALTH